MRLTNGDRKIVRKAIEDLLNAHAASPFGILREAGIQAELRQLLLLQLAAQGGKVDVPAAISYVGKRSRFVWSPQIQTLRVQLELKLAGITSRAKGQHAHSAECIDLIVFRSDPSVLLTCYPGGPGDVVALARHQDVDAAVEIKASPSSVKKQRVLYAADVSRLLKLARTHDVAGFFVLLDKSTSLYGGQKGVQASIHQPNVAPLKCGGKFYGAPPPVGAYVEAWHLNSQRQAICSYAY